MSPGWQSSSRQIALREENLTPFSFPVLNSERAVSEIQMRVESSVNDIFLRANITSKFTCIAMIPRYTKTLISQANILQISKLCERALALKSVTIAYQNPPKYRYFYFIKALLWKDQFTTYS